MWVGTAVQMESQNGQGEHDAFKQLALSRVSAVLVLGASVVGARDKSTTHRKPLGDCFDFNKP